MGINAGAVTIVPGTTAYDLGLVKPVAPTIGVLAVQGDVREHARALEACGARAVTVRRPGEVGALDGLVVPGGESTVMDKLVRAFGLQEPLRARIADGLPVIGFSRATQDVVHAFGHGHVGLAAGPKTARWVAALVTGEAAGADLSPYSAQRF